MNILVLTDTLPAPVLAKKVRENDVLVVTADMHEQLYDDVHYTFVFLLYTSFFTHFLSEHREHKEFLDLKSYNLKNRKIEIIAVPTFVKSNIFWPLYMKIAFLRNRRKLTRIIKENKIDIIHAQDVLTNLGLAYQINKYLKIPFVVTSRHLGRSDYIMPHVKKFISKAKGIINLGRNEKNLSAGLNPNSYLISHGIDDRFLSKRKETYATDTLKIVTVSRLLFWKNIDKIILALDQIKEGFTWDIYGEGPHFDTLKDLVAQSSISDKVVLHGHIDYEVIPETLLNYDLFVLPSFPELFGRVYIEAMACGLAVIGARNTGMHGYITEGEQGFLVNHEEVSELRDAIQRFISDKTLKVTMGEKAKVLSESFSWDSVINKLDQVYRSALGITK
jgi:glycosyltransferase involved in cell wall biosynthesis